jgi:hypothetical protein
VADPSVTSINTGSGAIMADRRGLQVLNTEKALLKELCADMPAPLMEASTRNLFAAWSAGGAVPWGGE